MAMLNTGRLAAPPHRLASSTPAGSTTAPTASSTPAGSTTAPTAKPHLTGTSNVGCADAFRMKRRGNTPLHSRYHTDCNAVDDATFLSVSSIPGLSTANMHRHTVPRFPHPSNQRYAGLTLEGVVQAVAKEPSFNGHFCLWFLGNDGPWIIDQYLGHHPEKSAVDSYEDILSKIFRDIKLKRLYLVTVPLRESDFWETEYILGDKVYSVFPEYFKRKFNSNLRSVFGNGNRKINGFPVSLVDLNTADCLPENDMENPKYFCRNERGWKEGHTHINAQYFRKFLLKLYKILEYHGGLSDTPSLTADYSSTLSPSSAQLSVDATPASPTVGTDASLPAQEPPADSSDCRLKAFEHAIAEVSTQVQATHLSSSLPSSPIPSSSPSSPAVYTSILAQPASASAATAAKLTSASASAATAAKPKAAKPKKHRRGKHSKTRHMTLTNGDLSD